MKLFSGSYEGRLFFVVERPLVTLDFKEDLKKEKWGKRDGERAIGKGNPVTFARERGLRHQPDVSGLSQCLLCDLLLLLLLSSSLSLGQ